MSRSIAQRLAAIVAVGALLLSACGEGSEPVVDAGAGSDEASTQTTATASPQTTTTAPPATSQPEITLPARPPSDYAGFIAQPTACDATAPEEIAPMVFTAPEDQALDGTIVAVIATSCGDITLELDPGIAPETVNSFVFLARAGYFDGTVSHRILPGFVLQAGDPTATGRNGPGYTIVDELPGDGFIYEKGILAMANSGPNSSGSQFFIMLDDAPLPPNYSVFGRVTDGFETLDRIVEIPLGPNSRGEVSVPLETLYLERVTIVGD
jgi:cyclophilin family peptidyl-prolyl cis-trans isomerase